MMDHENLTTRILSKIGKERSESETVIHLTRLGNPLYRGYSDRWVYLEFFRLSRVGVL